MHRTKLSKSFSDVARWLLELEEKGYGREEIGKIVGLHPSMLSRVKRIYLTSVGKRDNDLSVINFAKELVHALDEDKISISIAEERLIGFVRVNKSDGVTTPPVNRQPTISADSYRRAIANIEGVCLGLESFSDNIYPEINYAERQELINRMAKCRTVLDRKIRAFRRIGAEA